MQAELSYAPMLCEKMKTAWRFAALEKKNIPRGWAAHVSLYFVHNFSDFFLFVLYTGYAVKQGFRLSVFVEMCFFLSKIENI